MTGLALVCFVEGQTAASFYLEADTCLNRLAMLARFVSRHVEIHINYGHTDAKWVGRGMGAR